MYKYLIFTLCISLVVSCAQPSDGDKILTASGYEVIIHEKSGGQKIIEGDYVYFNVDIVDDKEEVIQSLRNAPELPVVQIPEGAANQISDNPVMEALLLASVGDSLSIILPRDSIPNLTPGMEDAKFIKYNIAVLEAIGQETFSQRVEAQRLEADSKMIAVKEQEKEKATLSLDLLNQLNDGKFDDRIITDDTGLMYVILEEGTGPIAKAGQLVETSYFGYLRTGETFDNSYMRGMAYPVQLGRNQVIAGWEIGLQKLNKGSRALFIVPHELGYGEQGSPPIIPARAELIFYIEVGDIFY